MSEFKSSSAPGRTFLHTSMPLTDGSNEILQSGYLNRKCVHEAGVKKSKDRSWMTLWCNLKGTVMEFYKVEGMNPKPQGGPPPKEMFPPPNMKQTKYGFVDLEDSIVDIDYTSQMNKEIQKRRLYLFKVVLVNDAEYIFQAPTEKKRTAWVLDMKQASRINREEESDGLIHSMSPSIKSSRDSIKQKSRQNVHSVKKHHTSVPMHVHGKMGSLDESDYIDLSVAESMMGGDPHLKQLKKCLQAKKELLKQVKTMYTSFMGGSGALYADALIHHEGPSPEPHTPTNSLPAHLLKQVQESDKKLVPHRRMSLPDSKLLSTVNGDEDDRRASTGDFSVAITTPLSPGVQSLEEGLETELLVDYFLVPGAKWSKLKAGETVRVLGRASNGWYQCMALREASITVEMDHVPGTPLSPGSDLTLSTDSYGSKLSLKNEVGVASIQEGVEPHKEGVAGSKVNRGSGGSGMEIPELDVSDVDKVSNGSESTPDVTPSKEEKPNKGTKGSDSEEETLPKKEKAKVERTKSYMLATQETEVEDYLGKMEAKTNRRKAVTVGRSTSSITPSNASSVKLRKTLTTADKYKRRSESASYSPGRPSSPQPWRILALYERERQTRVYQAPLIGCIAPSALKCFADVDESSSSGSNSRPSSDIPISDQNGHGEKDRPSSTQSRELDRPVSAESTELDRPVSSQSTEPDRPVSGQSTELDRPVSAESTELDRPVSGQSTELDRPVSGQSTELDRPVSGQSTELDRPVSAQSTEPDKPVSAEPTEPDKPVSAQVSSCVFPQQTGWPDVIEPPSTVAKQPDTNETNKPETPQSELENLASVSITLSEDGGDTESATLLEPANIDDFELVEYPDKPVQPILEELMDRKTRAQSLPPPIISHTPPQSPSHNGQLDISEPQEETENESNVFSQSSTQVTNSPGRKGRPGKRGSCDSASDLTSKPSFLKKFFTRKKATKSVSSVTTPESESAHTPSPLATTPTKSSTRTRKSQRPHTIARKKNPSIQKALDQDESFFESAEGRLRVSSVSGRPVRREGVGLVIGDDSSSESEEENEGEDSTLSSSYQEDSTFGTLADESPAHQGSVRQEENNDFKKQISESVNFGHSSFVATSGMKRSASDHDSLALKASLFEETIDEQKEMQPKSTTSLKRSLIHKMPSFRKPRSNSEEVSPSRKNKTPKIKTKKRGASVSDNYKLGEAGTPTTPETNTKWDVIFRAPPRGEKRFVYLDSKEGKFGFRLQSYGRVREQGKVLQTFVQSVVPGSVSFLAGLYPGDAIIEANGMNVKYAPVEDVVMAIQKGAKKMDRIALKVEFVDGVTRLDCMKKSDDVKTEIKAKQMHLKKLTERLEGHSPTPLSPLPSPQPISLACDLPPWGETTPTSKPGPRPFMYDRHLNNIVALHQDSVSALDCDVLVIPLSSCHQPTSGNENVLYHLLKTGGDDLLNEVSLAKQCRLGENIVTRGHALHSRNVYHCVFGTLEESLQRCCSRALEDASAEGHRSIAFWLDGFASISVSPQIIIESVRQWLQQGVNNTLFDRVVFTAKANINIIETFMESTFPLEYFAQRDSVISDQDSRVGSMINLEPSNESSDSTFDLDAPVTPPTDKMDLVSQNSEREDKFGLQNESEVITEKDCIESVKPELETESVKPELQAESVIPELQTELVKPEPQTEEECTEESSDLEHGDVITDLPVMTKEQKLPKPLLERTSISDIGLQLDLGGVNEKDLESESNEAVLESEFEEINALLACINDETEALSQVDGSPLTHSSKSSLSNSLSSAGLLTTKDDHSVSPSRKISLLNPDRQESDV